jgi:hypothetical protein
VFVDSGRPQAPLNTTYQFTTVERTPFDHAADLRVTTCAPARETSNRGQQHETCRGHSRVPEHARELKFDHRAQHHYEHQRDDGGPYSDSDLQGAEHRSYRQAPPRPGHHPALMIEVVLRATLLSGPATCQRVFCRTSEQCRWRPSLHPCIGPRHSAAVIDRANTGTTDALV